MGKDVPQAPATAPAKVVDKVMKQKNRFRSGLGFRGDNARTDAQNDKVRIAQAVSKKKILEGTRVDKTQEQTAETPARELGLDEDIVGSRNIYKGAKSRKIPTDKGQKRDEEDELPLQTVARTKYIDPRKQAPTTPGS